jgi:hypothetical protein
MILTVEKSIFKKGKLKVVYRILTIISSGVPAYIIYQETLFSSKGRRGGPEPRILGR